MTSLRQAYYQFEHIRQKGIEVKLSSETEVKVLAAKVQFLINANASSYVAYLDAGNSVINIETTYCDPVLSVEVTKTGIHFIPLVDTTWYGAFFEVLRIFFIWEEKKLEKETKEKEEEDEPSFDWI